MAFPILNAREATYSVGSSNSFDITDASLAAGDLLVFLCSTTSGTTPTGFESGWDEIIQGDNTGNVSVGVYAKKAAGTETSFGWDFSASTACGGQCWYFDAGTWNDTGDLADAVDVSTLTGDASGSDDAPDPASLTVPWTGDTFWIAMAAMAGFGDISTYPSSYGSGFLVEDGTGDDLSGAAYRNDSAFTTQNPGAFALASADEWVALTVAIAPAPSASGGLFFGAGF